MPLPGRLPTQYEMGRWRKFERTFDRLTLLYIRARIKQSNADVAVRVGNKHGMILPYPVDVDAKIDRIGDFITRTRKAIRGVEDHKYGIRVVDGDIDILEPEDEEGELGAVLLAIALATGAVIVVGAIAHTIRVSLEAEESEEAYEQVVTYADQKFCARPGPACTDWNKVKESVEYKRNESYIDGIATKLGQVGGKAMNVLGWGLVIAVPVLLYSWFGRRRAA